MKIVCCAWLCLLSVFCQAQQYLVFFNYKNGTSSFDKPEAFLSQKSMARRLRYGIGIDSTDLPLPAAHLNALTSVSGIRILNTSRWMNAVSIIVSDTAALAQVAQFSFVQSASRIGSLKPTRRASKPLLGKLGSGGKKALYHQLGIDQNIYDYGRSAQQVELHKGQFLHNAGLRGDSIIIGMLDAGFFRYNTLPAFDSLVRDNRVLGTWDFVAGETGVAEDHPHGMQCLSVIAANIQGSFVGSAPRASFYLFRSEDDRSEKLIEEFNWVCAAERLDSAGGDIISASVGYSVFDDGVGNHSYSDLNGDVTIAARGADMAARKGILVVTSAGNSGDESWKYIATPADGDSVLSVGAVDAKGAVADFSSYGPAADGRIKPEVASVGVGTILQGINGAVVSGNGTSFSAPNIAGLAACLWQGFREANNMQIMAAMQQSGNTAATPNNRIGYGLPDMQKAAGILLKNYIQAAVSVAGCRATVSWRSKDAAGMQYIIERRAGAEFGFKEVGLQPAGGTSWANRNYSFADHLDGVSGPVQYRIKTVLDTAAASYYAIYTDTIAASNNAVCNSNSKFSIIPNPAQNNASLLLAFPEQVPFLGVALINTLGQEMWQQKWSKPIGYSSFALPVEKLVPGKYYLRITSAGALLATIDFLKL